MLVYVPTARRESEQYQVASCSLDMNGRPIWIMGHVFGFDIGKATHWQPLPPAPENQS